MEQCLAGKLAITTGGARDSGRVLARPLMVPRLVSDEAGFAGCVVISVDGGITLKYPIATAENMPLG